jgi:DNA-binding transcriptional MocR family regulator
MATVLAEKSNASGTLWYSQHSLTAYSGLSTRTVGQHLATLVARGYLQVLSIGVRTEHWRSIKYTPTKAVNSQTYRLHIPEGAFTLSEPRLSR